MTLKFTNWRVEILAGFSVAMTMIPESLSFAILAGLSPLTGLYAAFLMGITTAVFGGRPGMVSGGAGATVVVLMALAKSHGVEYLFAAVAVAGILQMLVGLFKLGKFVRLIPQPVMYGFLNGLAVIIFMSQLLQFKILEGGTQVWMHGQMLWWMTGLTVLTIGIVLFFPKVTKIIPSSLAAIIIISLVVYFFDISTKKVVDIASVKGSFPHFHIPQIPLTFQTITIIFPYAVLMAVVGLIESLLTLGMVDELTNTRGNSNKEVVAQGIGNFINGFFAAMGGCAMVAQTLVNLNAGARTKLSAGIGAVSILLIIMVGSPFIEQIPMAALVGVMMMVAIKTFQWSTIKVIRKFPVSDIFVGILVAAITIIFHNLAVAVILGVIISALVFAWNSAKHLRVHHYIDDKGVKQYEIFGDLFFGSTTLFLEKFDVSSDPDLVLVDFKASRVVDMSAIEALNNLTLNYTRVHKKLVLCHLDEESRKLIHHANGVVEVNMQSDMPHILPVPK